MRARIDKKRVLDIMAFLLKIGKERTDESGRLLQAKEPKESALLLEEANLLLDAHDILKVMTLP